MKRIPSRATWLRRYILQKKYAYLFYIQFEKKIPKNVGLKQQQKKNEKYSRKNFSSFIRLDETIQRFIKWIQRKMTLIHTNY